MAGDVTNELIYELLKRVHETQAQHTRYHQEARDRLSTLEMQYASLSRRVDRIDDQLERINRRLDLTESPQVGE